MTAKQASVESRQNVLLIEISVANLIEALPDALLVIEETGTVCLANAQAEWLFGRPRAELVGMNLEKLMPERFRRKHMVQRADYVNNPAGRSMGHEKMPLLALNRTGAEIPVSIALAPLMTASGMFVIAVIRRT